MDEEAPVIGIDLGTTYSVAAVVKNDHVEIIHGDDGLHLTASCVYFNDKGEREIGNSAKKKNVKNLNNWIYGVKRFIGRDYEEYKKHEDRFMFSYTVENKDEKPKIVVETRKEVRYLAPEEISAMILEKLKERAEEVLRKKVTKAVITVPAHFNDAQRQATKDAGRIAGLEVLRILNEPTAAAMAYELQNKYRDSASNILIYDFGGGTFDVTIVTIDDGVLDVKATNGDPFLGGDDIDKNLCDYFIKEFNTKYNIDISHNKVVKRRLQSQAEQTKRNLSTSKYVNVEIDSLFNGKDFNCAISRAQFEQINMELFQETISCVEETLEDADMSKDDIHEVVLVGGSTRIPKIREMVREYFNNKVLNASLHPDEAVAIGAARQAAMLSAFPLQTIRSVVLYDVCSLSLGVEVTGGRMSVIIPKNSKIPTTHTEDYGTADHFQTQVRLKVFEGERLMTAGNRQLGEFILSGFRSALRGQVQINVTFHIDTDGILHCSAVCTEDNVESDLTINSYKNHLSENEIKEMMVQAERFREDDVKLKLKVEAQIDLQQYCYDVQLKLSRMNVDNKNDISYKCEEILDWVKEVDDIFIADIKEKKMEIVDLCKSFM